MQGGDRKASGAGELLDVTVPSVSGHYIELERQGKLSELLELEQQRERLSLELILVNAELARFESPVWILNLGVRVRRAGKKLEPELRRVANQLDRRRNTAAAKLREVEGKIARIDPLILQQPAAVQHEPILAPPLETARSETKSVLFRDWVIKVLAQKCESDAQVCKQLDLELASRDAPPIGIPESWNDDYGEEWRKKYGWNFYQAAYDDKRTRNRIQKMIWKAKTRF